MMGRVTIEEEWCEIAGHHFYDVSSLGRIRSKPRYVRAGPKNGHMFRPGKILKPWIAKNTGYAQVCLADRKSYNVHRLVAIAFLAPDKNRPLVNHKNGKKDDNRGQNLEWCTASENGYHACRVLGIGRKAYVGRSVDGTKRIFYPSGLDARRDGFSISGIGDVIAGRAKSHKGFTWERA